MTDTTDRARLEVLDRLDAPDLFGEIERRSRQPYVAVDRPPSIDRRRRLALAAAAALIVVAFLAGRASRQTGDDVQVRDRPPDTTTPERWSVLSTLDVPVVTTTGRTLVAASGRQAWVSRVGGDRVSLIDATGTPRVVRNVEADGVVDVAPYAEGGVAVLQGDGSVVVAGTDGSTRLLTRLDRPDGRRLAATGLDLWISGGSPAELLRVSAAGRVEAVAVNIMPGDVYADGAEVWVLDDAGQRLVHLALGAASDEPGLYVGQIQAPAVGAGELWWRNSESGELVRLTPEGTPQVVAPLAADIGGLAVTATDLWTLNGSLLQRFDRSGALRESIAPQAPDRASFGGVLAATDDRVWVAKPQTSTVSVLGPETR